MYLLNALGSLQILSNSIQLPIPTPAKAEPAIFMQRGTPLIRH